MALYTLEILYRYRATASFMFSDSAGVYHTVCQRPCSKAGALYTEANGAAEYIFADSTAPRCYKPAKIPLTRHRVANAASLITVQFG